MKVDRSDEVDAVRDYFSGRHPLRMTVREVGITCNAAPRGTWARRLTGAEYLRRCLLALVRILHPRSSQGR